MKRDKRRTQLRHTVRTQTEAQVIRRVECVAQLKANCVHCCMQKLLATSRTASPRTLRAADRQGMLATLF